MKRDIAALAFALTLPTLLAVLYFVVLPGPGAEPNPVMQAVMALGKAVQFSFPLIYLWFVDRSQLGWPLFCRKGLGIGITFGVLTALALFVLYFVGLRELLLTSGTAEAIQQVLAKMNCLTPLRYILLAAFYSLAHSLLEEYYWRWFLFGRMRRYLCFWPAALISSLGFMSHHVIVLWLYLPGYFWELAVPLSLCVAIGGAFWCWLYEYSRSIYAIWLSHLIVDVAILVVGYDLVASYMK